MKTKPVLFSLFFAFCLALLASPVLAQSSFTLNVHRNVGYSSGAQIRGSFNMAVVGPTNIQSVTFLIDGQPMKQVTAAPFSFNFDTTAYALGWHDLSASIQTTDGQTFTTPVRRFEFASAEEESASVRSFLIPLLGVVGVILLIVLGGQLLFFRNKTRPDLPLGTPRKYGISGGAVCPKCHRPFPLSFLALNAGINSQFTRCIFCGKWSVVRRLSLDQLRAAEAAELAEAQPEQPLHEKSETEKMKDLLDESRFTDRS
jgi:hypothetical protein